MNILRAVFANKDPLIAFHMIQEIPYKTVVDFIEYLDVYEAIQQQQHKEMEEKIKNKGK